MSNRMKVKQRPALRVLTKTQPDPYSLMIEMTRPVYEEVVYALGQARTALDAELTVADLLRDIEADAPADADAADRAAVEEALTAALAMYAAMFPQPMGLALVRALAVVGPTATHEVLAEAAARIVEVGVVAPDWVDGVGRANPLRAWVYGDVWGAQESLSVVFDQAGHEHVVLVLLDHDLGGGIKDAMFSVEIDALENGLRDAADTDVDAMFAELPVPEARARLAAALSRPDCPVEPDQIEDVAVHRRLLTARLAGWAELEPGLEPRPEPRPEPGLEPGPTEDAGAVLRTATIKVGLRGAKPPIWRRLEVPADITLGDLHRTIQLAFGWEGSHLHDFATSRRRWADPLDDLEETLDESTTPLLKAMEGRTLTYTYDFGDNWVHRIDLESAQAAVPGVAYPRCVGGRRAAPPDDIGGIGRYDWLVATATDRSDPGHLEAAEELAEWGVSVRARFDAVAVTRALRPLARLGAPTH